jgi:hypothetical protein
MRALRWFGAAGPSVGRRPQLFPFSERTLADVLFSTSRKGIRKGFPMLRFTLSIAISLLLSITFAAGADSITLADGLTHTLTSGYMSVYVADGPGSTMTTVNIEDGAMILE